jgi:hypothetical protein
MTAREYPSVVASSTTKEGVADFLPAERSRKRAGRPPRTRPAESAPLETEFERGFGSRKQPSLES